MSGRKAGTPPWQRAFPDEPDLLSPGGEVEIWFTDPPGAVLQMPRPTVGTAAMARWIVSEAQDRLYGRFPGVAQFIIVFDLAQMTSRDAEFRSVIAEAAKETRGRVTQSVIIPAANGGTIYQKALEIAVMLLRGFGVNLEISRSLPLTLSALGLKPAGAAERPTGATPPPPTV